MEDMKYALQKTIDFAKFPDPIVDNMKFKKLTGAPKFEPQNHIIFAKLIFILPSNQTEVVEISTDNKSVDGVIFYEANLERKEDIFFTFSTDNKHQKLFIPEKSQEIFRTHLAKMEIDNDV